MKFLFLLLLPLQLSAQVEIDTSAVLFKAKLLTELAKLPPGKRIKRKHECFPKCSDVLYQWLVIPNRKD